MKGYLDNTTKTLYIFPQTAAAIPSVAGATSIAIQQEDLAAWKEENEAYANMMFAYNYLLLTVKPKVWSGHENDNIGYDIVLGEGSDTYIEAPATAEAGSTVTITPKTGYSPVTVNIACEEAVVTPGTNNWTFTMPESDVTITATADTHTISYSGDTDYVTGAASSLAGETITVLPADGHTGDFENITLTSSDVEITKNDSNWTFTMPDENVSVAVSYVVPTCTLTFEGDALSNVDLTDTNSNPITENPFTVYSGGGVIFNAKTGYTFDKEDTENTVLAVYVGVTEVTPETWSDGGCWYGEQNTSLGVQTFNDHTFTVSAYTPQL